ncbi:MAG: DUF167 domain-containing protein [Alphaproteobacteria bacterium]
MFFTESDKGILLRVRISPNSSSCSVKGIFISAEEEVFLKINIVSVPEKGKANRELISYLSKKLKIAKSCFEIVSGETDRYKKILIKSEIDIKEVEKLSEEK